jgi:GAF domain-containing protein
LKPADRYRDLLRAVLTAMAGGDTLGDVLQRSADAVVAHFDASYAGIWMTQDAGASLRLAASGGVCCYLDLPLQRIDVGRGPIGGIAHTRAPALVHHDGSVALPQTADGWPGGEDLVGFAGYPLLVGDSLVGVIALFARRPLPDQVLGEIEAVADSIALGIERRQAAEKLHEERQSSEALRHIGLAFAHQLDLHRLVQMVTDAATILSNASFGAFFYVVDDDHGGSLMLYALSGAERSDFDRFPIPSATPLFAPTFAGKPPIRLDDVTLDSRYGRNPPHRGMPEGHLPVRSYLAVPVLAHDGGVVGALFFGHPAPGMFDEQAERNVVGLAGYAASAIQNARLFDRERFAALTLQRSLLPLSLPDIPGASLTSAYQPASNHSQIGGDWYDALALPGGTISLTVGDVGGHDLRAAGVMGQLRTTFRLSAVDSDGPVEVLRKVDRYHSRFGAAEFATAVQAMFDPATRVLRVASAGHPAPLLIEADGRTRFLAVDALPVLGYELVEQAVGAGLETTVVLEPGAKVLFFTDGLVERRGDAMDVGLGRLAETAATVVTDRPRDPGDALLAALLGPNTTRADDVALLLLSIDP